MSFRGGRPIRFAFGQSQAGCSLLLLGEAAPGNSFQFSVQMFVYLSFSSKEKQNVCSSKQDYQPSKALIMETTAPELGAADMESLPSPSASSNEQRSPSKIGGLLYMRDFSISESDAFFSCYVMLWVEKTQTLEQEGFVPVGVEVLPLDLGLQLVLLVGQQVDFDEGVGGAGEVFGWELLAPQHFNGEGRVLEAVAYAELDPAQLLADRPFAVIVLGTRRELRGATNAGE